jgi:hypothetical protein
VDFLTGAVRIAEAVRTATESAYTGPSPSALRLLWRFAVNIPGAMPATPAGRDSAPDPRQVIEAADAELEVHVDADRATRADAARRARTRLSTDQQLFGTPPRDG